MRFFYDRSISILWVVFLLYWMIAAGCAKKAARRESLASGLLHMGPLFIATLLLAWPDQDEGAFCQLMWPRSHIIFWCGFVLILAGFGVAIWARIFLGRNWSGTVNLKQGHEPIQTGPYGWARHPIYTGLLLAFGGTGLTLSEWRGAVACVIILIAFRIKLGIEERWMTELFPVDYPLYQKRVHMLIPYLW